MKASAPASMHFLMNPTRKVGGVSTSSVGSWEWLVTMTKSACLLALRTDRKLYGGVFNLRNLLSQTSQDLSQFFHLLRIELVSSFNAQRIDPWSPPRARSCIRRS